MMSESSPEQKRALAYTYSRAHTLTTLIAPDQLL